ncbi:MAG: RCC1 repeat-containing protein, partial [Deltaproteobacteria bacterium]|nr:RCC1 repeat-containing protein [Deltaproteobacteria bacterium]
DGRSAAARAQAVTLPQPPVAVDTGRRHTCAIIEGGADVACWGDNASGQLGLGTFDGTHLAPEKVQRAWTGAVAQVSAGDTHTCIVAGAGEVWCWGSNYVGELGDGTFTYREAPVRVTLPPAARVEAGLGHTCALLRNGNVACWGTNRDGELGDGTGADSPVPVLVVDGTGPVVATALVGGESHACAIVGTGAVACWGDNSWGQQGDGGANRTRAALMPGVDATALDAGPLATCADAIDGHVCWGGNDAHILRADAGSTVTPMPSTVAVRFAIGRATACTPAGACWGDNFFGQVGDASFADRGAPADRVVDLPAGAIASLSMGYDHACAVAGATAYCWGDNAEGQLGIGTRTRALAPVRVALP